MLAAERANESKKEERKRNSLLFLLEYTLTDYFFLHTVFDEANRKIAYFTRAVQSARCERSWREERDVSTKN